MNLKRLAEISPIVGAFLIFIGFLNLHLYYEYWGIQIAGYLDFSEILLAFLSDINILLFFSVLVIIQLTIALAIIKKVEKETETVEIKVENSRIKVEKKNALDEIFEHGLGTITIFTFFVSLIFAILFIYFNSLWLLYFTLVFGFQALVGFLIKLFGEEDMGLKLGISLVIMTFCFTYGLARNKYITKLQEKKQTQLALNDGEIVTSSTNITFIGKTNQYYFLYYNLENYTRVIPVSSVKETEILQSN